jgi:V/A-type H+-transporting ATPase subunit I
MRKVRIVAPRSAADRLLALLCRTASLHPIPPYRETFFNDREFTAGALDEEIVGRIKRGEEVVARATEALRGRRPGTHTRKNAGQGVMNVGDGWLSEKTLALVDRRGREIVDGRRHLERIDAELAQVAGYRRLFERFLPLIETIATSRGLSLIGVTLVKRGDEFKDEVARRVERVTDGASQILWAEDDQGRVPGAALIIIPTTVRDRVVREALGDRVQPMPIPDRYKDKSFAQTFKRFLSTESRLIRERIRLEERLRGWEEEHLAGLAEAVVQIGRRLNPLRAREMVAYSDRTVWISGWAPLPRLTLLRSELFREFGDTVSLYDIGVTVEERGETPTLLNNHRLARPFERLLDLYGLPTYGQIDPTPLLAVTLPLFYGLILGDVGYAAVLFLAGWAIRRRYPRHRMAKDIGAIVYAFSFSAALFGVLYGEFFGDLWQTFGFPPALFHRKEEAKELLYGVILFGGVHLALGSLMAVANEWRRRNLKAIAEKSADILFYLAAGWSLFRVLQGADAGWAPLVGGGALVVKTLFAVGWVEPVMELPRMFSGILSYVRLMALGMASVILADLANEVGADGAAVGVMAAIGLHAANILLGAISPTIQAVRLHYVEFFNQFYKAGRIVFAPLTER